MSDVADGVGAVDDLVELLTARVKQRRAAGHYPEGLEDQLDAHFRRIVFHRARATNTDVQAALDKLDAGIDFRPREVPVDSGFPGGEILHRAIDKAIERQRQSILDQVSEFADAVRGAVEVLGRAVQDPNSHVHADLIGRLDAVLERLESYERRPAADAAALGDLRRRIEALERAEAARNSV